MGKIRCICGTQISNASCPNTVTGLLLRDLDMEAADGRDQCGLMDIGRGMWECYSCGRIAFDWPDTKSGRVKFYRPEDGTKGDLCARREGE